MGVARARPLGVLAVAGGAILAGSPHPFTLSLELSNPDLLYAGYRRRLWITTGLILCATAAAMLGLAGLWRSFRRQARLAEMKSNFVSSVSHELRAPIGAVRLMAESLESGRVDGDAKRQEYFSLIAQECRRLSTLVENVLDFSRIEQGREHYNFEPVDVAALVRQAAALMAPHAAERNVRIEMPGAEVLAARWDH